MKLGHLVVDTHVHPQRHAVRFSEGDEDAEYARQRELTHTSVPADEDYAIVVYDDSDRLVYDMGTYSVDPPHTRLFPEYLEGP